jgi:hypothetical protein
MTGMSGRSNECAWRIAGIVVDRFIGSGTTAVAALGLGRQFIGIEQSETTYGWRNAGLRLYRLTIFEKEQAGHKRYRCPVAPRVAGKKKPQRVPGSVWVDVVREERLLLAPRCASKR